MSADVEFMREWGAILRHASKSSTYKFALARALIDTARAGHDEPRGPLPVSRARLAELFIEYYWPLVLLFHLRQLNDSGTPAVISRILAKRFGASPYVPFAAARDRALSAAPEVARRCFSDVLRAFHNVKRGVSTMTFFERDGRDIVIPAAARAFLTGPWQVLRDLVNYEWTRWLERQNRAPRIALKVGCAEQEREAIPARIRNAILHADATCFYCGVHVGATGHCDHFLPWSFLFHDEPWDLVAACVSCNAAKTNCVPSAQLVERFHAYCDQMKEAHPDRAALLLARLPLRTELVALRLDALADGFGEWCGPTQAMLVNT